MVANRKRGDKHTNATSYAEVAESYAADPSEEHSEEGGDDSIETSEDDDSSSNSEQTDEEEPIEAEEEEDDGSKRDESNRTKGIQSAEGCTFDLRNLVAINSHQVDAASLYSSKGTKVASADASITIPPTNFGVEADEEQLLEKAKEGCTQLISALWQLPTERSDAGPMVTLPGHFEIKIPRALPPPPPKKETKWEKFAKERGISVNKEKRSRKVWDEASGTWMYRHGYEKANNDAQDWPIMEVKGNEDPYADPWEKIRDAKRSRVEKNLESRMRNQEQAGILAKGTATRVAKSRERARVAGKAGGNKDRDSVPSGVPVDLKTRKGSQQVNSIQRGKQSTSLALLATQRSTASLGKFDKMREGEPERKKAMAGLKKRKFESATDKKVVSSEADRGMKLLNTVMNGGGVAREKAKRNGILAKGETAYDFEFDDGLGAGSFRKKKGRAGSGKMRKLTKKRVK